MKILHTADWHLGRIFHGIHLTDDQAHSLQQIKTIAQETKVDVIVIAGDIYDRAVPPPEAVKLLDDTLCSFLFDLKIPVIMIAGNHDSPDRLSFGSRLFATHGLHLCGSLQYPINPVILSDENGPVYFYPIPYAEPSLVREKTGITDIKEHDSAMSVIVNAIKSTHPQKIRSVICAHAFVQGGVTGDSERPLTIGGTGSVDISTFNDFSCTLLGHLHRPQCLSNTTIHYSGSLMSYSFSEVNHRKSVTIIDIDKSGAVTTESMQLSPLHAVRCIDGTIAEILSDASSDSSPNDYIMIKLRDREPILDAMGKFRSVYPNVLHIERTGIESFLSETVADKVDHRKISDEELFSAFFSQTTGVALSDTQRDFLKLIIQKVNLKEREADL
jgi:DNA repair protein SbcD/Mre11